MEFIKKSIIVFILILLFFITIIKISEPFIKAQLSSIFEGKKFSVKIEKELTSRFESHKENKPTKLSERSRQATHHTFDTKISILQIEQSSVYQLEVITDDRHGLLSLISDQLSKEEISINHAKINTLGSRAEDTFLISYKNNLKMSKKKINDLIEKLNTAIA